MLSIRFLGDQHVARDGSDVAGALGRRGLELLGYLSVHADAPQLRQQIATDLWPESSTAQALTNLRGQLHQVRHVLGEDGAPFATRHRAIEWCPTTAIECDAVSFRGAVRSTRARLKDGVKPDTELRERAAQGAAVYEGELLPGYSSDWLGPVRERLHRDCVYLLDVLLGETSTVDPLALVNYAERRVELEPLEEVGYRHLMTLQAQVGDRAAALRTYHRCASLLDRELGVGPSVETVHLYEGLVEVGGVAAHTPRQGRARRSPLVGRQSELQAIAQRWQACLAGQRGLHIVMGEAGVGKSRLLNEFVNELKSTGTRVLRAGCPPGATRPLGPVAEWLSTPSLRAHIRQLDPCWRTEIERLLKPKSETDLVQTAMVNAWQRRRFIEGLLRGVVDGRSPTLLVLDDLQWCDAETTQWLSALLGSVDDVPLLVLASARSEDVTQRNHVARFVDALGARDQVTRTPLWPLTSAETATLASRLLDVGLGDVEAARWQDLTGGYPLFVVEYARVVSSSNAGDAPVPRQVHAILQRRLRQLSEPAQLVATTASCLHQEASLSLLVHATGFSREALANAIDELWRRRVFRAVGARTYAFTHELLREAAYELMDANGQVDAHSRMAHALELEGGSAFTGVLAEQYACAKEPAKAISFHRLAASQSSAIFANLDAIDHCTRALELLAAMSPTAERDETELVIQQAMSAPLNAQFGYASQRLRRALERSADLAESQGKVRQLLQSLVGLFAVRYVQGDIEESFKIAARSLELSPGYDDVVGQAHFAYAGAATSLGRHEEAIPHFEASHRLSIDHPPSLVGTRPEVHGRAWSAHPLWLTGRDHDAVYWSSWAVNRAHDADHPYSLAVALAYAAMTHQLRRDREETARFAKETTDICAEYDFAYYREWGVILDGWCMGGHAGIDRIGEGLRALRAQGAMVRQPYFLSLLAETWLDLDELHAADAVLDAALTAARERHDRWWLPELCRLKARSCSPPQGDRFITKGLQLADQQKSVALARRIQGDPLPL